MIFDIVITWVNWADKNFIKKMKESGGKGANCKSGDFIELKYLLRSLEIHKINYNKIHIVYSDNHPPPEYLKETKHLSFVPHSKIVSDLSNLPLIHRPSITSHLHKIPDLSRYYFYLEDDLFIMNKNIFSKPIELYNDNKIYIYKRIVREKKTITESCGLWYKTVVNSYKLFSSKNTRKFPIPIGSHCIQFFDKNIMDELESLYPEQFNATWSYKNQKLEKDKEKDLICVSSLFNNYLIYKKDFKEEELSLNYSQRIHTSLKTNLTEFKDQLEESKNSWLLNAQGNGISDEYLPNKKVHDIFYSFLEKKFPNKTEFEK